MARSLQELIDFLLNEVAICSDQGVYSSSSRPTLLSLPLYSMLCLIRTPPHDLVVQLVASVKIPAAVPARGAPLLPDSCHLQYEVRH